jgi:hypothetical protein
MWEGQARHMGLFSRLFVQTSIMTLLTVETMLNASTTADLAATGNITDSLITSTSLSVTGPTSLPTTSPTHSPSATHSSSLAPGAIVGIVVGATIVLVAFFAALSFFLRRRFQLDRSSLHSSLGNIEETNMMSFEKKRPDTPPHNITEPAEHSPASFPVPPNPGVVRKQISRKPVPTSTPLIQSNPSPAIATSFPSADPPPFKPDTRLHSRPRDPKYFPRYPTPEIPQSRHRTDTRSSEYLFPQRAQRDFDRIATDHRHRPREVNSHPRTPHQFAGYGREPRRRQGEVDSHPRRLNGPPRHPPPGTPRSRHNPTARNLEFNSPHRSAVEDAGSSTPRQSEDSVVNHEIMAWVSKVQTQSLQRRPTLTTVPAKKEMDDRSP